MRFFILRYDGEKTRVLLCRCEFFLKNEQIQTSKDNVWIAMHTGNYETRVIIWYIYTVKNPYNIKPLQVLVGA